MQLTPAQVRSTQIGLIAQAALAAVAKVDPTILGEVSARKIDLQININGREVPMEDFCERITEAASLGRASTVLNDLAGEVLSLNDRVHNLDPMVIARKVVDQLTQNLQAVDLTAYVSEWAAPEQFHDAEISDIRSSLRRITSTIRDTAAQG